MFRTEEAAKVCFKGQGRLGLGGWGEGGGEAGAQLARQDSLTEVNHEHLNTRCYYKDDMRGLDEKRQMKESKKMSETSRAS